MSTTSSASCTRRSPTSNGPDRLHAGPGGGAQADGPDAGDGGGTAFWAAAGLTALAIVPCIVLMRAERAGRRARTKGAPADAMAEAVAA